MRPFSLLVHCYLTLVKYIPQQLIGEPLIRSLIEETVVSEVAEFLHAEHFVSGFPIKSKCLFLAAESGSEILVELFIFVGAEDLNYGLIGAIYGGNLEMVKYLISKGAYYIETAYYTAIHENKTEISRYLRTLLLVQP